MYVEPRSCHKYAELRFVVLVGSVSCDDLFASPQLQAFGDGELPGSCRAPAILQGCRACEETSENKGRDPSALEAR